VSGSPETGVRTYAAIERVFNNQVKEHQRFLSFDMKWVNWGEDSKSGKKWW